jgi:hypothetical protein
MINSVALHTAHSSSSWGGDGGETTEATLDVLNGTLLYAQTEFHISCKT